MTNLLQKTDKGIATFIAIFLVFLMSTGAFIGVAENNSTYNGIETNDPILPSNKDSEIVNEGSLDISSNEVDNTLSEEYPTAIVPPSDENIDPDFIGENNNELELVDTETGENFVDPDYIEIPTKKDNEDPDRLSDV